MPLSRLINGSDLRKTASLNRASAETNKHIRIYLRENVQASVTIQSMKSLIQAFTVNAPRLFVSKCIDGRVHGSLGKGYPPGTVTFSRTEGNNVALTPENSHFWNRVNGVMLDAKRHTPGSPALFIALAHSGKLGSGCAAHGQNDDHALKAVREQALAIRKKYAPDEFFVLYGMTNTDDGAERLTFLDGREVSTAAIISALDTERAPLKEPVHLFQPRFLDRRIDDPQTDRMIGGKTPRKLMTGTDAAMFHDLKTTIAMEAYLLQEVTRMVRNDSRNNVVFDPHVFAEAGRVLRSVKGLPENLQAPLLYQTLWNMAFTLHQRRRVAMMKARDRAAILEHAEDKVGYGEGFETEPPNRLVLAKPGRGDDRIALNVARTVLLKNRKKLPQKYPPVVHVNVEIAGDLDDWQSFNRNVLSLLKTRVDNVHTVFGGDCRVLLTYSRSNEKCFYPVRISPDPTDTSSDDPRESCAIDVTRGLTDESFNRHELRNREEAYKQMLLLEAA